MTNWASTPSKAWKRPARPVAWPNSPVLAKNHSKRFLMGLPNSAGLADAIITTGQRQWPRPSSKTCEPCRRSCAAVSPAACGDGEKRSVTLISWSVPNPAMPHALWTPLPIGRESNRSSPTARQNQASFSKAGSRPIYESSRMPNTRLL